MGGVGAPAPPIAWRTGKARMRPDRSNYAGKGALIHVSDDEDRAGVERATTAIEAAGGTVTTREYPGTHHAFFHDDRPEVHHPQTAATAWARTLELFRSRLA